MIFNQPNAYDSSLTTAKRIVVLVAGSLDAIKSNYTTKAEFDNLVSSGAKVVHYAGMPIPEAMEKFSQEITLETIKENEYIKVVCHIFENDQQSLLQVHYIDDE